ncbi:MAG: hypothetical protein DHS20C21_09290 [Gemmatimonadota bacterium]|nr:MAG: hypothetical protein DHS20C21_09290 [Gemmatimonadota bacterium]
MRLAVAAALLFLAASSVAGAATLRVPEDYASVLAAVDAAVQGDSVLIGPGTWDDWEPQTHVYNGFSLTFGANAFLKRGITLVGTAGATSTILQAPESSAGAICAYPDSPSGVVRLVGLTLRGGGPECTGIRATGSGWIVLEDCVIEDGGLGVAIDRANLSMFRTVVRGRDGSAVGQSGIRAIGVDVRLEDCTFEDNVAGSVLFVDGGLSSTTIRRCRFVNNIGSRMALVREQYPLLIEDCWFEGNVSSGISTGFCLGVSNCEGDVRRNTFANNRNTGHGAGVLSLSISNGEGPLAVYLNTVYGTLVASGSSGAGITMLGKEPYEFHSNIVAGCRGGPAVFREDLEPDPSEGCNVFWDNDSGEFDGYEPAPTDVVADPQFCDPASLDFTVSASSVCAPGGISGCGQIGAHGVGCGSVAVQPSTWGRVKAGFRETRQ